MAECPHEKKRRRWVIDPGGIGVFWLCLDCEQICRAAFDEAEEAGFDGTLRDIT